MFDTYGIRTFYKIQKLIFTKYDTQDWNIEKKTSLLESIFLEFPLSTLYFIEDKSIWHVLDGNKRLQIIFSFFENTYQLDVSSMYPACSYSYFTDLARCDQALLEKTLLTCIVIDSSSPKNILNTLRTRIQR